jgi:hypothetical protein
MQQLILLLTSFLLGCGFPVFLDSGKHKHKKSHKYKSKDQRKETGGDRPGREKPPSPTFSSSKRVVTRSILGPTSTSVDVLSPSGQTISLSVPPPTTSKYRLPAGKR